jgi:hypothetical protein
MIWNVMLPGGFRFHASDFPDRGLHFLLNGGLISPYFATAFQALDRLGQKKDRPNLAGLSLANMPGQGLQ